MGTGIVHLSDLRTFEDTEKLKAEQILAYFNIEITDTRKCNCFLHHETLPSMQVNTNWVYCYGCKKSLTNFGIARTLLSKRDGREWSVPEVFEWFNAVDLPEASKVDYGSQAQYIGAVDKELINHWHSCLTPEHYAQLLEDRLLTKATVDRYLLGWRPEWKAWSIPFLRASEEVDIVQFRLTEGKTKYIGLKGHNRGAVMNADLLEHDNPYLFVLFGAYDAILARQDGLLAVGLNGCMPFKKTEKKRVQEMFAKQSNIILVPDNTPAEYTSAYKLEEWLGAEVRFFDSDLPPNLDYIDYRKLGNTPRKFLQDMQIYEYCSEVPEAFIEDVISLIEVGDPYTLIPAHIHMRIRGVVARDVAWKVADHPLLFSYPDMQAILWQVTDTITLEAALKRVSQHIYTRLGGW